MLPSTGSQSAIRPVAKDAPVPEDLVRFTNGDVLSGEIEEILEGAVEMRSAMAEGTLTIPIGGVREVVFKDTEEKNSFAADRVVLLSRESLSGRIEGMKEGKVVFTMPSSQRVEVDAENVAAVAFYRGEEVLVEENFDSGLPEKMRFEGGRWCTQRGCLVQAESRAAECFASLPVTQTGQVVYEWSVNTTIGRSTGLYFMASDPGPSQEKAYLVRILRNYVYVYLCMNGEEVHCGGYRISLYKSMNKVRLVCDSQRGIIELCVDGKEVGLWKSSVPIKVGKYVVLRADGRAAFDDLTVVRRGGTARIEALPDQGGEDLLTLVNGDEVRGRVTEVSNSSISYTAHDAEEVSRIEREKLFCVRFGRKLKQSAPAMKDSVVIMMRDGDTTLGQLLFLKDGAIRIMSEFVGVIDLNREDVRKIIFRKLP